MVKVAADRSSDAPAFARQPVNEWRAGWRIVVSGFLGTGTGIGFFLMTAGLLIVPMQQEFGWSRSALTIGPMVLFLTALLQPIAGEIVDRFGARLVLIIGMLILCAAYLMLAATPADPWIFYAAVAGLALAGPITNGVPQIKGVATWFVRNPGLAFGLTLSGTSIATGLAMPLIAYIIADYGWRTGFVTLAAAAAFIGLPAVIVWFREKPQSRLEVPDKAHEKTASEELRSDASAGTGASLREALQDKRYWLLIIALGGVALPMGGYMSQLQPLLVDHGFAPVVAASIGTVYALAIGSSRIVVGALLDHFNPSIVAAVCMALPTIGAAVLILTADGGGSWFLAAIAAALIGLPHGAEADFIAYFTRRLFGLRRFSVIFGTVAMVVNGGVAIGGILYARVFDMFGSYHVALYASIGVYLCAALVMLTIKVPPREYNA